MLVYYDSRLRAYRKDLKTCFSRNKARIRNCLAQEAENLTEAERSVLAALRNIFDECHRPVQGGSKPPLESLVMECFQMRGASGALHHLEDILESPAAAKRLHICMCYLGRLRTAYHTFFQFATALPAFTKVTIHCVTKPKISQMKHAPLTMAQTFKLLELELSEPSFRRHISSGMTLSNGANAFGVLQKQIAHVHAEMQLLHHAAKEGLRDIFPFIGVSKRSCFLCASFIKADGRFTTRGTHGHLYSKWYIPQTGQIAAEKAAQINTSLRRIQHSLKQRLRIPIAVPAKQIAESSVGLSQTLDEPRGQMTQHYLEQRTAQEHNQAFFRELQQVARNIEEREIQNSNTQAQPDNVGSFSSTVYSFLSTTVPSFFSNTFRSLFPETSSVPSPEGDPEEGFQCVEAPDRPEPEECLGCGKSTTRTCSKCGRDRYCSLHCEEKRIGHHIFSCNMGRPINTADLLMQDCIEDCLPSDPDVEEDFGFHRLYKFPDKLKLLGLYKGLYYSHVSAESLHEWRLSGTLLKNIIATFSKLPANSRGSYYPWFLEHQYALDGTMTREEAFDDMIKTYDAEARIYLDLCDRNKPLEELKPPSKRSAFLLLKLALQGGHPPPADTGPYYDFGFCTCNDMYTESSLGGLYQELLVGDKLHRFWTQHLPNLAPTGHKMCTFDEFWRAHDTGNLINLMDEKGFRSDRQNFKHLASFLKCSPNGPHPSVWGLQAYLNDTDREQPPASVYVDYGFIHCDGYFETMELKEIYRQLLRGADHLELHRACVQGQLWSFATSHMEVEARFERIIRNFYGRRTYN